jgi:hypothetical protein
MARCWWRIPVQAAILVPLVILASPRFLHAAGPPIYRVTKAGKRTVAVHRGEQLVRYVKLKYPIERVIPNPRYELVAAIVSGKLERLCLITPRRGKRRCLVLSRDRVLLQADARGNGQASVWSPDGSYLQLSRAVGDGRVYFPDAVLFSSHADLSRWVAGGPWKSRRYSGSGAAPAGGAVRPWFWGWAGGDAAIVAEGLSGTRRYVRVTLPQMESQLLGTCTLARRDCHLLEQRLGN